MESDGIRIMREMKKRAGFARKRSESGVFRLNDPFAVADDQGYLRITCPFLKETCNLPKENGKVPRDSVNQLSSFIQRRNACNFCSYP